MALPSGHGLENASETVLKIDNEVEYILDANTFTDFQKTYAKLNKRILADSTLPRDEFVLPIFRTPSLRKFVPAAMGLPRLLKQERLGAIDYLEFSEHGEPSQRPDQIINTTRDGERTIELAYNNEGLVEEVQFSDRIITYEYEDGYLTEIRVNDKHVLRYDWESLFDLDKVKIKQLEAFEILDPDGAGDGPKREYSFEYASKSNRLNKVTTRPREWHFGFIRQP